MKPLLIAANWKMHKTAAEAKAYFKEFWPLANGVKGKLIVLCVPFTCLHALAPLVQKTTVCLGAQDVHFGEEGAFTGEISPRMLTETGASYVIVGHSERRKLFHEDDELVNKKLHAAISHGLKPIFCVGESLEQRNQGKEKKVVASQVLNGLKGISWPSLRNVSIAYEPVWAIGTGVAATPKQAGEMHTFIREVLEKEFGQDAAKAIPLLYGGSVKTDNIKELTSLEDVDGALVGGASLDAEKFSELISNA
ncbi:triose-phosphate isomerase [Candidatus Woesearchaeota archaeon]|nr:triose-phosphate isomerase [Candidatus Woesearchaeota archaeon]